MSCRKKAEFAKTWLLLFNCSVDYRALAASVSSKIQGGKMSRHTKIMSD